MCIGFKINNDLSAFIPSMSKTLPSIELCLPTSRPNVLLVPDEVCGGAALLDSVLVKGIKSPKVWVSCSKGGARLVKTVVSALESILTSSNSLL